MPSRTAAVRLSLIRISYIMEYSNPDQPWDPFDRRRERCVLGVAAVRKPRLRLLPKRCNKPVIDDRKRLGREPLTRTRSPGSLIHEFFPTRVAQGVRRLR